MKFSFITNADKGILIYWSDNKGILGKRTINKYNKDNNWFVTAATGEQHAIELMQLLTK